MFELKLAALAASMYRRTIKLSIKLVDMRDRRAFKKYNKSMQTADQMDEFADLLYDNADEKRTEAETAINENSRNVNSAMNLLQNAEDYIPFR